MVFPPGVEPGTCSLGGSRSIRMSYGNTPYITPSENGCSYKISPQKEFFNALCTFLPQNFTLLCLKE